METSYIKHQLVRRCIQTIVLGIESAMCDHWRVWAWACVSLCVLHHTDKPLFCEWKRSWHEKPAQKRMNNDFPGPLPVFFLLHYIQTRTHIYTHIHTDINLVIFTGHQNLNSLHVFESCTAAQVKGEWRIGRPQERTFLKRFNHYKSFFGISSWHDQWSVYASLFEIGSVFVVRRTFNL